jgi:type IV pilus assembly protein PilQ
VKEIDKRPPQVSIEAMILSVQLDDQTKFGINFQALRNQQHLRLGVGNPRQAPLGGGGQTDATTGAPLGAFDFASGGMNFAFLDGSLGAFLNFLETIGDTNVIATPRIMCLNKQRAEIQIGQQLGYVTTTLTSTATAQTINFLDTGAQLRLRPFISADGLIRMEVHPELSTGSVQQSGNYTLPNKEVTQVTTNVMVRDGCTVVIGGLMREDLSTSTSQVPLIGSLPVVGPFFRNKTEEIKRNEILVLITPRIVYEPQTCEEGECGAKDFISRQSAVIDHMSPIGKRYMGRKALRRAQAALAAGDRKAAVRWADKAVYFDHENLMAVQFRDQLQAGAGPVAGQSHTAQAQAGPTMAGQPLDGEQLPPWLLDGLEGATAEPVEPLHPRDPGQPGRMIDIERGGVFDDAHHEAR